MDAINCNFCVRDDNECPLEECLYPKPVRDGSIFLSCNLFSKETKHEFIKSELSTIKKLKSIIKDDDYKLKKLRSFLTRKNCMDIYQYVPINVDKYCESLFESNEAETTCAIHFIKTHKKLVEKEIYKHRLLIKDAENLPSKK